MNLSNAANNELALQMQRNNAFSSERKEPSGCSRVALWEHYALKRNFLRRCHAEPRRAFSTAGNIATAADSFPSFPSFRRLPYFFA